MSKSPSVVAAEVNAEITSNGVGAITGAMLNGVLIDMIGLVPASPVARGIMQYDGASNPGAATFLPTGTTATTLGLGDATSQVATNAFVAAATAWRYAPVGIAPTIQGFFAVTTTAGTPEVTIAGANFTAEYDGACITIIGVGPASSRLRLVTTIETCGGNAAVLSAAPTQTLTGIELFCFWGGDHAAALNAFAAAATAANAEAAVPPGNYFVGGPVTSLPPYNSNGLDNNANTPPPLLRLMPGATLIAGAAMAEVLVYGGVAGDYSEYLRSAIGGGGKIDGNMVANYGVSLPFANDTTIQDQYVANTLLAHWVIGDPAAPATTQARLRNCKFSRDIYTVPIATISVSGTTVTIETTYPSGIPNGAPIVIAGANIAAANARFCQAAVSGPVATATAFTLENVDGSTWGSFASAQPAGCVVAMTMPSCDPFFVIAAITTGNPTTLTLAEPHGMTGAWDVLVTDVYGASGGPALVDGPLTATVTGADTVTVPVNTTGASSYIGNGWLVNYRTPETIEKAVYYRNADDCDFSDVSGNGIRLGVYANPAMAGWNGSHGNFHFFNYPEQGEMWRGVLLGGRNKITMGQVDGPVKDGYSFFGAENTLVACWINISDPAVLGVKTLFSNFCRLDSGGSACAIGGGANGDTGIDVLSTISFAGMIQNYAPGWSQVGFADFDVAVTQPDTLTGSLVLPNEAFAFASLAGVVDAGVQLDATNGAVHVYNRGVIAATVDSTGTLTTVGGVTCGAALAVTGGASFSAPVKLPVYTVSTLPAGANGDVAYASNARVGSEGSGVGTGAVVSYSAGASAWQLAGTDTTAAA